MHDAKNLVPSFYSGFLKLFSGLAFVKLFNFTFSLILPRFYSADDYALFGIFTAIILILAEMNSLKLEITVFFPKDDKEALEIVHVIFLISLFFSLFILVISFIIILAGSYNPVYLLLAFVLMIKGTNLSLSSWFNRKKNYKILNTFNFIQSLATSIISLVLIIFFKWHFGLIIGFFIGQLLGMFYLLACFKYFNINLIKLSLAFKYLHKYKQFPKYGVLSSLLNSMSKNSVVLFIKFFFGALNAGYYTLASRVLDIPGGMYSSALTQIYLQQASLLDNRALKIYTKKIIWFGFMLGIVPLILFLFFGQSIFGFVFGTEWLLSGKMAQFIALGFFFEILIGPVGFLLDIKQKLRFELNWNFMLFAFRILAILTGVILNNVYTMLLILTIVGCIMNSLLLRYVLRLANEKEI